MSIPGLPASDAAHMMVAHSMMVRFWQNAWAGGLDCCTSTYPEDAASVPGLLTSDAAYMMVPHSMMLRFWRNVWARGQDFCALPRPEDAAAVSALQSHTGSCYPY